MPNTYRGEKPIPVRPGSEDALKLPSLENGQRTPYKPPVAQCVGMNRGSTGLAT